MKCGDAITVRVGRFGPYVTDGTVNASVPKGRDPASLTLDEGVDLLARREERLRADGKDPRAKTPRRAPAAGARRRAPASGAARKRKSA